MDMIVNSIVSNYLADYLEINPEKTKTSILSGTVELSGVKFKKNLFTTLNIPYLELEDGYIGRIKVQLSLPRFYLYPIIIIVDQIYIKVRPKNVNKISEKEILNTFEIYKKKKLKEFEELMNVKLSSIFQDFKNNKKESSSMIENIINNLHIDIEKIVIIFDDCISNPKYPCTFGITLNKLYIDSTSKDFTDIIEEEDKSSPFKYKKLSIISLNLFLDKIKSENITKDEKTGDITAYHKIKEEKKNNLNEKEKSYLQDSLEFYLYCESEIDDYSKDEKYHNYLLRELNFDIKLTINEEHEVNNQPKISAIMETSTILTQITNKQMKAISNNVNYISLKDLYQQTTIDNYYKSKEKLDNDTIKKYLEDYSLYYKTKYIDIYKNDKENKKYLENMEKIEQNLSLDNIKALREMGNDIINNIIEIGKIDKEIQDKENSWSNFFSSRNSNDIAKLKEEREQKLKEQKIIQEKNSTMNQFKNYITGIFKSSDEKQKMKEDKPQFNFEFIMKELILIINEEKKDKIKKLFEIKYDLFKCEISIKALSQYIKLSLRDMELTQYISNNKNYKKILYSKDAIDNDNKNKKDVSLILIEFEHNFTLPISPFKFKLHFDKQIYIIIDYYYLYYLYNLFLKHLSAIDLNNLTSMVNERIGKIVKKGYNKLIKDKEKEKEEEKNNKKSFNINVDILLNAPILLLPLYFKDENNTELMSISFGQLKIYSKLADDKDKNAFYDKYLVDFSNISIKTLTEFSSQENIKDEDGEKILCPSSFSIDIEKYIYNKPLLEHKTDDFSSILVNMDIKSSKFSISEEQIIFMIKYLENFKNTQYEFEKENAIKEKMKNKIKNKNKDEKKILEEREKEKNKEIEEKEEEENNINDNLKKEKNKMKEINNIIKISVKFGVFQIFLMKNLMNEQNQTIKKIKFLSFFFRESTINYIMKSNGSMDMEVSFGHFNLYDKDEDQKEKSYINPEFKCLMGTTPFGIKDKNNNLIKFSNIYEYKFEKGLKESIKILLNLDAENKKTTINISMSKLTISPNFSTLIRLYLFLNKYLELYNQSMNKIKVRKLFENIGEEKSNTLQHTIGPISNKIKLEDNIKEKKKLQEKKEAILKKDIKKSREFSTVDVIFTMKGIDIFIPVDPSSHNTSIIFMTVEIPIKYTMKTDVELEFNSIKIIKINYNIKSTELSAKITNGIMSIYSYKDDAIVLNSINKIYDNIDFSLTMNGELDKNQKCNNFTVDFKMNKEMDLSFNINHLIVFWELFTNITPFLNDLKKKENENKKEDLKLIDEDNIRRAKTEELLKMNDKNEEKKKKIKNEKKIINIINYNDIINYKIQIANISIKFYDIIDGLYQSLLEFSMNNTQIQMYQNSNPRDCTNLMTYLINTFSNEPKKLSTYEDKKNFYLYFNIKTNIEFKTLNNYLNQWEYLVEPLSLNCYYCQFLKRMRPIFEMSFENMLNINLSLNLAKTFSFILKRLSMKKENIEKNKEGELSKNENNLGIESPILIIENYTGVDMEIWFDNIKYDNSNNDLIIKLKNNDKYEFTNNSLKRFNVKKEKNNLNSTISYKFCIEKDFIKYSNINEKNLIGNYLNINYHHNDIHDINEIVKVSIESTLDNMLCRRIVFNSLISIINETQFNDIKLCNNDNTQKIDLKEKNKQPIPISWFLSKNKNINLSYNNDTQLLMKNISEINDINRCIQFNNKDIIIIDVIRYKINLEEYYYNKNVVDKKDIYRVDIIISWPINIINNTPYTFYVNNNDKISSTKSLNVYNNNFNLLNNYVKIINEKGNKSSNEKQIILKIIKDMKLQIHYNNILLTAFSYLEEKNESNKDDTNEEGKTNNFSSYNKNLSIALKDDKSKTFLICRIFLNNPFKSLSYNDKIYKTMKLELNSFNYEIIFDYYFVNKTNYNIYLNNKSIDGINIKSNDYLIPENNYIPISKTLLNSKLQFKGKINYWSGKVEISAIGEDFSLNIKNEDKLYNPLGIKIRISDLFKKSIDLIIDNKYVIVNDLPFDIIFKEDKLGMKMKIKSNGNKILFLNEESVNNNNNYRIGIGKSYSCLFDIDKLGIYDLLIEYNKQVFEENKIDTDGKLVELNNKKYYPIRCIINTNKNNIIYILFTYNKDYINQFRNYTPNNIELIIDKENKTKITVKPETIIPLVYINKEGRYEPFETVTIMFNDKTSQIVTLNEISTIYSGKKKDFVIIIQPDNNNSVKRITVFRKDNEQLRNEYNIKDIKDRIRKYTKVIGYKINLFLFGIGFSIINEKPKEIFYFSLYDIHLCYKFSKSINILNEMVNYHSFLFALKNLQLDYCLDDAYEIVFNPTNQILPPKPEEKKDKKDKKASEEEEETPFIQFVMSHKNKKNQNNEVKNQLIYSLYPQIAIIIQEFDIRINTILINSFIKLINEYSQILLPPKGDNNEELKKITKKKDNDNNVNDPYLLMITNNYNDIIKEKEQLLNKEGKISNLVINNLTLSAIRVNVTFKVNRNAIEISYLPEFIITLMKTFFSTFTSFSDVTLKLNEISFLNVFSDFNSLKHKLMSYYKYQVLAQIYKIILNIDLFGNPFNLLEGVGTGIFQFFNEPRKGLLKGPEEFGLGIKRGVGALVSNVVGGGFNTVSKITGTLLSATKNISSMGTEKEVEIKEEDKPKGFISGTVSGFKKGFGELAHGVTGIVTKPIEETKKSGISGFFSGVGSGLVGAFMAPVNTVLTVGNEVSSGISNSEFISNKKRLRRFRLPRTLYKYLPISPYDEVNEMEKKKQRDEAKGSKIIIVSLNNEKLYLENSAKIVLCQKMIDSTNMIFTDVLIKILDKECIKLIKKIYVCDIKSQKENNNEIELTMKNESKIKFTFRDKKGKNSFVNTLNKYLN